MEAIVTQLAETLREAAAHKTPLRIVGGGTKNFYGNPTTGETFSTNAYRGIVEYEPTELVITARAGTPLAEVETALREKGQMLAFEPPHFSTAFPSPPTGSAPLASLSPESIGIYTAQRDSLARLGAGQGNTCGGVEGGGEGRGSTQNLSLTQPLTPTLSPQAGRGD